MILLENFESEELFAAHAARMLANPPTSNGREATQSMKIEIFTATEYTWGPDGLKKV